MNAPFEIQGLIDKGYSYIGMINEAKSKCLLLKEKMQSSECLDPICDPKSNLEERLKQIDKDIHKYSAKLMNVCQKLRENGALC